MRVPGLGQHRPRNGIGGGSGVSLASHPKAEVRAVARVSYTLPIGLPAVVPVPEGVVGTRYGNMTR